MTNLDVRVAAEELSRILDAYEDAQRALIARLRTLRNEPSVADVRHAYRYAQETHQAPAYESPAYESPAATATVLMVEPDPGPPMKQLDWARPAALPATRRRYDYFTDLSRELAELDEG